MIAVVDGRAPHAALLKLHEEFDVIPFHSQGITYEAVSGHPDIFMFQHESLLILAPNTPPAFIAELHKRSVRYRFGQTMVGPELADSSQYNCFVSGKALIHRDGFTDNQIMEHFLPANKLISVPQSYCRCSAIDLGPFILTSDKGILQSLQKQAVPVEYIDPDGILLPPYPNGFIGGCCGVCNGRFYVIGSPSCYKAGDKLRLFAEKSGLELVPLYDGPLYDAGGIFFVEKH